jgi:carbon storage regulator CsrA
MLVLSRRINETICLPGLGITIRVVRIQGVVVRIGIEAPTEVKVLRGELFDSSGPVAQVAGSPRD